MKVTPRIKESEKLFSRKNLKHIDLGEEYADPLNEYDDFMDSLEDELNDELDNEYKTEFLHENECDD